VNSTVNISKLHSINPQKPLTVQLTERLSVRLYSDSRPHCMETSALQKGLVLMLDNQELIEEGVGFGLPIAKYVDKTYFSSSAEISIEKTASFSKLKKTYTLDLISKKLWQKQTINDRIYSKWRKTFAKSYLSHKELSPIFNKIMELRAVAKIKTEFIKVKPRGKIAVTYEIQPTTIKINVDFSDLTLNSCQELLVLNEQGSTIFGEYFDANNLKLTGNKIGGWAAVAAKHASLFSANKQVAFSLQRTSGATLFRGYEKTKNRFSWAGLSYSMQPTDGTFDYAIELKQ
jgi:hypothetical protein